MAKGISNTSRTLEYLRSQGWVADKVERFNPFGGALDVKTGKRFGVRKDMFGFGDIVAMGENSIFAIQSCGQAFAEHNRKITQDEKAAPNAFLWLKNGGRLLLIGWRKVKLKHGGKAMRWKPRIKEYSLDDFIEGENSNSNTIHEGQSVDNSIIVVPEEKPLPYTPQTEMNLDRKDLPF